MNILILTHGIAPEKIGGSETQTLGLATELAKNHQVLVISRADPGLPRIERRAGFLIKRFGVTHPLPFPVYSFAFKFLTEVFRRRKEIDIVFAKTTFMGLIAVVCRKLFKIPVIMLIEGEHEYRNPGRFSRFLFRAVSRNIPVIAQTNRIQKELKERNAVEVVVIPNGVEQRRERARGNKIVYIGRLIRGKENDKGVRFLIEAAVDLGMETLIIGDGPEKRLLEKQAQGYIHIEFAGPVPPGEIPSFLEQGFVLVLPSVYGEGLPNVILEAMAVGLPVIATNIAGIKDVIRHGETGYLIEPGNVEEIKRHILLLNENPDLRSRMSENCVLEAGNYAWEKIALRFEQAFRSTIRSCSRSNRPLRSQD
jgi:glycosyltransferase involved in cell wall biosynthesis